MNLQVLYSNGWCLVQLPRASVVLPGSFVGCHINSILRSIMWPSREKLLRLVGKDAYNFVIHTSTEGKDISGG